MIVQLRQRNTGSKYTDSKRPISLFKLSITQQNTVLDSVDKLFGTCSSWWGSKGKKRGEGW